MIYTKLKINKTIEKKNGEFTKLNFIKYQLSQYSDEIISTGITHSTLSIESLMPSIIAILVFVVGFIINHFQKNWYIHNELLAQRNAILDWLDFLEISIYDQIGECKKQSDKIKTCSLVLYNVARYKFSLDEIDYFKYDRFISVFLINSTGKPSLNRELCFKLFSKVQQLILLEKELLILQDDYFREQMKLFNSFQEYHEDFEINSMKLYSIDNDNNESFLIKLRKIHEGYMMRFEKRDQSKPQFYNFVTNYLIKPVAIILDKELKINPSRLELASYRYSCHKLSKNIIQLINFAEDYSVRYKRISNLFNDSLEELIEIKENINKERLKKFWFVN